MQQTELGKYGQKLDWFNLEFDENKVITDYNQDNIENLNVAGFIDTEPVLKREGLYNFWIKNPKNVKILVNYWGLEAPNVEQGKVFVFTNFKPNYYMGILSLTIQGPFYSVPWEWKFDGNEKNASSKIFDNAES